MRTPTKRLCRLLVLLLIPAMATSAQDLQPKYVGGYPTEAIRATRIESSLLPKNAPLRLGLLRHSSENALRRRDARFAVFDQIRDEHDEAVEF